MKERAADGKRVAAECEYLKKYALPYKTISYMIEVHHVGYQMKALQILSWSMYELNSFGLKKFSTRLSYFKGRFFLNENDLKRP